MENPERICYHTNRTQCYTYFRITGDFDPDIISDMLNLKPEKTWKIGDKRQDGKPFDFASWRFGTCDEYDVLVENQMWKTIAPLLEKVNVLKKIKQDFDVTFTLAVVPTVRFDEPAPCLAPSLEVMQFCCDTGTEMDIDLYVSAPDAFEGSVDFTGCGSPTDR